MTPSGSILKPQSAGDAAPLLRLTGIRKSFGAVHALQGVSMDVRHGEVHALLGENGAGKSTLIKVVTGAHTPDAGTIEWQGAAQTHLTPARARDLGIACIYQQPALFPDLSIAENLALRLDPPRPFRRISRKLNRDRAAQLLSRLGAPLDPDLEVRQLSMPEQQLVEIAAAVGAGARLVIMDEPTASLTETEVERLHQVVRDLQTDDVGVLYISHRLTEIFALADRVTVLRDGESVASSPVEGLDEQQLIQWMVGREVDRIHPPATSRPGEVVLSMNGVGCRQSGVHRIQLELRAGEVLGLAGLIGAGRTELARILFGITPADTGDIRIEGRPVQIESPRDAIREGIAYVPEDRRQHGVIPEMSVAHNLSMAQLPTLFPGGWLRTTRENQLAGDYIERLSIKVPSSEYAVATLSGGNQQKVALGRWLATHPKILILDEPTQGVDVGAKSEIHLQIRELAAAGMAVLLISSDLPEILGMSQRIAVMRGGTIVAELPGGASAATVMAAAIQP